LGRTSSSRASYSGNDALAPTDLGLAGACDHEGGGEDNGGSVPQQCPFAVFTAFPVKNACTLVLLTPLFLPVGPLPTRG